MADSLATLGALNLWRFCRINFLVLFVWQFFGEVRHADGSYGIHWSFPYSFTSPSNILLLNLVPEWFPQSLIYIVLLKLAIPLGLVYGMVFPHRRWGYLSGFLLLFCRTVFEHSSASVLSSLCLIPMLLMTVAPPTVGDQSKVRARLVVAFSAMYLFSVLAKINFNYLSGAVLIQQDFRYLVRPFWNFAFDDQEMIKAMAWVGLALQFIAGFLWVGQGRKIALIAALSFHALTSLTMVGVVNVLIVGGSLVFLVDERRDLRKSYLGIVVLTIATPFVLQLGAAMAFTLVICAVQLSAIRGLGISETIWKSKSAAVVSLVYFSLAWALSWPEPLGFAQYSGRNRIYYGIKLISMEPDMVEHNRLKSRWSVRFSYLGETEMAAFLPSQKMVEPFLKQICGLNPKASFQLFETKSIFPNHEDLRRLAEQGSGAADFTPCRP